MCILHELAKDLATKHINLTPWSLVRERTIPTVRPPLVGEIFSTNFCG
jgi:hypothetical protein